VHLDLVYLLPDISKALELARLALEYHHLVLCLLPFIVRSSTFALLHLWSQIPHTPHHSKGETSSTAAAYSSLHTSAKRCAWAHKALELARLALEYHHLVLCLLPFIVRSSTFALLHLWSQIPRTPHHSKGETSSTAAAYSSLRFTRAGAWAKSFAKIATSGAFVFSAHSVETIKRKAREWCSELAQHLVPLAEVKMCLKARRGAYCSVPGL